jgi:hypothetical protein
MEIPQQTNEGSPRKNRKLIMAAVLLIVAIRALSIDYSKEGLKSALMGSACLSPLYQADQDLEEGKTPGVIELAVPAARAFVGPLLEPVCGTVFPEDSSSSPRKLLSGTVLAESGVNNDDEGLVRTGVFIRNTELWERYPGSGIGQAELVVPEGYDALMQQNAMQQSGSSEVLDLVKISQGKTDYYIIPFWETAEVQEELVRLGLANTRPIGGEDGDIRGVVPGIVVQNLSGSEARFFYYNGLTSPDGYRIITVVMNHVDTSDGRNFAEGEECDLAKEVSTAVQFHPASKLGDCIGSELASRQIADTALFTMIDRQGRASILSGRVVRSLASLDDYESITPFTFPLIVEGKIVQNHLAGRTENPSDLNNRLGFIVNSLIRTGIYKVTLVFATANGGLYSADIPLGLLESSVSFTTLLEILESNYGRIENLGLGDWDFSSHLNTGPVLDSAQVSTVPNRSHYVLAVKSD